MSIRIGRMGEWTANFVPVVCACGNSDGFVNIVLDGGNVSGECEVCGATVRPSKA
ncbi:hypothetical protein [Streptosporangium sp. NPDC001681]|uniref:hypothetical protein n=1 Tax=Streptosporangium sp. NPDC001681 TaxID=3154395 RepID=UPI00332A69B9